jgi:hypothetical protein
MTTHFEDKFEQLPEAELLACTIEKMLNDGDEACRIGGPNGEESQIVTVQELALMLCDVLRSERLGVAATPATRNAMDSMIVDLAIYRAMNRV